MSPFARPLLGAALLLAGCQAQPAPLAPAGISGETSLTIRLSFMAPAAPYRLRSIPGGTQTVRLTLSNPDLLPSALAATLTAPSGGGEASHTFSGLRPGTGYALSGEARGASGTVLGQGDRVVLLDGGGQPRQDALGRTLTSTTFAVTQGATVALLQLSIAPIPTLVSAP